MILYLLFFLISFVLGMFGYNLWLQAEIYLRERHGLKYIEIFIPKKCYKKMQSQIQEIEISEEQWLRRACDVNAYLFEHSVQGYTDITVKYKDGKQEKFLYLI